MRKTKKLCMAILFTVLFLTFTVLICTVDVQPVGPMGTSVGFASINAQAHKTIGESTTWYKITQWLGYAAVLIAASFGVLGLVQWIGRKKLLRVDRNLLALGILFVAVIALYFFFESVIVNYRPMLMPGETELEASFPSSHTILALTVFGGTFLVLKDAKSLPRALNIVLRVLCILLLAATVIGRLLSGAHWLTDILAGILLTGALLAWFDLGRTE